MIRVITSYLLAITLLVFGLNAQAHTGEKTQGTNEIIYQITQEKWIKTDTANVIVNLNASLDQQNLDSLRKNMTTKLTQIIPNVDWRITQFKQSKNNTGLETVNATAQARVPNSALANLRDKAEKASKPGETFTIANIDYSPSMEDLEQTQADLRATIYNKIQAELAKVNQTMTGQHYFVHRVDFINHASIDSPQARRMMMKATAPAESLPVNDKVLLTATVIFAAPIEAQDVTLQPKD